MTRDSIILYNPDSSMDRFHQKTTHKSWLLSREHETTKRNQT